LETRRARHQQRRRELLGPTLRLSPERGSAPAVAACVASREDAGEAIAIAEAARRRGPAARQP
jgi:hypothetical protein